MPFDYDEYQKKCDGLSTEQLHKEVGNFLFSPFPTVLEVCGAFELFRTFVPVN